MLFNIVKEDYIWLLKGFIFLVSSQYDGPIQYARLLKENKCQKAQPLFLSTYNRSSFLPLSMLDIRIFQLNNIMCMTSKAVVLNWWIATQKWVTGPF